MKRYILLAVFATAVLSGTVINSFEMDFSDRPDFRGTNKVMDCRNSSTTCNISTIDERTVSCDPWQPWIPYSRLDCDRTTEGVEDISLVTDPANYIPVKMTDAEYKVETVADTKKMPWDLAFLPSGDKIWTRKNGYLMRERGSSVETYDFDSIRIATAGLMGVAVHPEFEENRFIYLHYAYRKTNRTAYYNNNKMIQNRISRFKLTDSGPVNETVLKTVPGSRWHSGGRLEFGPDGKLYATTGDADNPFQAAYNTSYLGGSILRMNPDGSVPEDNPFDNVVYSFGHRNPQGIAWNPETGDVYNSEHGPWRHDEINRVLPGERYGWGGYKCSSETSLPGGRNVDSFRKPERCFKNWSLAPSGMAFVDEEGHPWYGDLFVAGLRGKQIYRLKFDGGEVVGEEIFYVSNDMKEVSLRFRDVDFHDGSLYALGDTLGMVKITPS